MDAPLRAVVACIAGRLITGAQCWAIQDHDRRRPVYIDCSFGESQIRAFSHELGTYISGLGDGTHYMLFEHRRAGKLTLEVNVAEKRFSGCDQRSACRYFGGVSGGEIHLFDFADVLGHTYTL